MAIKTFVGVGSSTPKSWYNKANFGITTVTRYVTMTAATLTSNTGYTSVARIFFLTPVLTR